MKVDMFYLKVNQIEVLSLTSFMFIFLMIGLLSRSRHSSYELLSKKVTNLFFCAQNPNVFNLTEVCQSPSIIYESKMLNDYVNLRCGLLICDLAYSRSNFCFLSKHLLIKTLFSSFCPQFYLIWSLK